MSDLLLEQAMANGIWSMLAVALLVYTIKTSDMREEKLMEYLDKTNDAHQQIADSMNKLENRMDEGFSKVWERIDKYEGR